MRACAQIYLLSFGFCCLSIFKTHADTPAYKCIDQGKTFYSQLPCKGTGTKLVDLKSNTPTDGAIQDAVKAQRQRLAESNKLQKVRERAEAKEESKNRAIVKKMESEQKQCDAQQLKTKWAKEDLSNSQPKNETKARAKLKRANERTAIACKST